MLEHITSPHITIPSYFRNLIRDKTNAISGVMIKRNSFPPVFSILLPAILALLLIQTSINAQSFKWAKKAGGSYGDLSEAIAVDTNGNVYSTGNFNDIVDFDPGPAVFNLMAYGFNDVFITKLDSNGNFLWARQLGGSNDDRAYGIAVDDSQHVYTIGAFTNTADFDPGIGSFNLTSAGGADIFISKLDAAGNFIYAKQIGSTADDIAYGIALDSNSNVFTTGYFGATADFDPGTGVYPMTPVSSGDWDIFVSKLDAAGNFVFAKQMGGSSSDWATDIALDHSGNILTTGSFGSIADFDPGLATYYLSAVFSNEVFVSKLDPQGNFIWAKRMGGPGVDIGNGLAIGDSNQVYTTGFFQQTADFDPGAATYNLTSAGGSDIFISRLDSLGNFVWANRIGSTGTESGAAIVLDNQGNVYTTGDYFGTVDFDPGTSVHNIVSNGIDAFISKLSASGDYSWSGKVGGSGNDAGNCMASNAKGNIYIGGAFQASCDFDPGPAVFNLSSSGNVDAFVMKLGHCSSAASINTTACSAYTAPSGNHTWTASGVYTDTLVNANGCDSIITIHLTVNAPATANVSASACNTYTSPSGNYIWTTSGTYHDTLTNAAGCDSMLTIILAVSYSSTSTLSASACNSYVSPSGNYTWIASGTYTDTLINAAGCDSIITVNLLIHNSASSITVSACDSYTSPSGNYVWTTSGTYPDTLTNMLGCDSLVTVHLSMHYSVITNLAVTACDQYTSPSGNHVWNSTGVYHDTMATVFGCDSTFIIQLGVNHSTSGSLSVTSCFSYTSPSGLHTWSASGTFSDTLLNAAGCDSVLTIQLTVNTVDVSVTNLSPVLQANAIGASYQWLDCNTGMSALSGAANQLYTATTNGSYAVKVTQSGCTDTSACITVTNVGLLMVETDMPMIYPNPTGGDLRITCAAHHCMAAGIYNAIGQKVFELEPHSATSGQLTIPGPAGLYFLQLKVDDRMYHYRIAKEDTSH